MNCRLCKAETSKRPLSKLRAISNGNKATSHETISNNSLPDRRRNNRTIDAQRNIHATKVTSSCPHRCERETSAAKTHGLEVLARRRTSDVLQRQTLSNAKDQGLCALIN